MNGLLISKDDSDDNDNLEESDQELVQVNGINDGHESSDMDADDWKRVLFFTLLLLQNRKGKRNICLDNYAFYFMNQMFIIIHTNISEGTLINIFFVLWKVGNPKQNKICIARSTRNFVSFSFFCTMFIQATSIKKKI